MTERDKLQNGINLLSVILYRYLVNKFTCLRRMFLNKKFFTPELKAQKKELKLWLLLYW